MFDPFFDFLKNQGIWGVIAVAALTIAKSKWPAWFFWVPTPSTVKAAWNGAKANSGIATGPTGDDGSDDRPAVQTALLTLRDHAENIAEPEREKSLAACDTLAVASLRPRVKKLAPVTTPAAPPVTT